MCFDLSLLAQDNDGLKKNRSARYKVLKRWKTESITIRLGLSSAGRAVNSPIQLLIFAGSFD